VKQLVLGGTLYSNDNAGLHIPDILIGGTTSDTGAWLKNLLDMYGKSTNVAQCPIAINSQPPTASGTVGGNVEMPWLSTLPRGGPTNFVGCYGYNGWLFSDQKGNGSGNGYGPSTAGYFVKDTSGKRPSDTPMFFDEEWTDCWPLETDSAFPALFCRGKGTFPPTGVGESPR